MMSKFTHKTWLLKFALAVALLLIIPSGVKNVIGQFTDGTLKNQLIIPWHILKDDYEYDHSSFIQILRKINILTSVCQFDNEAIEEKFRHITMLDRFSRKLHESSNFENLNENARSDIIVEIDNLRKYVLLCIAVKANNIKLPVESRTLLQYILNTSLLETQSSPANKYKNDFDNTELPSLDDIEAMYLKLLASKSYTSSHDIQTMIEKSIILDNESFQMDFTLLLPDRELLRIVMPFNTLELLKHYCNKNLLLIDNYTKYKIDKLLEDWLTFLNFYKTEMLAAIEADPGPLKSVIDNPQSYRLSKSYGTLATIVKLYDVAKNHITYDRNTRNPSWAAHKARVLLLAEAVNRIETMFYLENPKLNGLMRKVTTWLNKTYTVRLYLFAFNKEDTGQLVKNVSKLSTKYADYEAIITKENVLSDLGKINQMVNCASENYYNLKDFKLAKAMMKSVDKGTGLFIGVLKAADNIRTIAEQEDICGQLSMLIKSAEKHIMILWLYITGIVQHCIVKYQSTLEQKILTLIKNQINFANGRQNGLIQIAYPVSLELTNLEQLISNMILHKAAASRKNTRNKIVIAIFVMIVIKTIVHFV